MSEDQRPCVLVIDNDDAVVKAISTRLESQGYRCQSDHSGEDALSGLSMGEIDLIITDLNMPQLDGPGLIEKIRKSSMVPIIIVTGYREEYARRLQPLGYITILEKPFDSEQLLDLVTAELTLSHRRAG